MDATQRTRELFAEHFGTQPRWVASAPGRVNLMGDHVDYNGGIVSPMAIERSTIAAAAPLPNSNSAERHLLVRSSQFEEPVSILLETELQPDPNRSWIDYVKGVAAGFEKRGLKLPSMQILIHSTLPMGGGLSSSAALEVAVATMFETAMGKKLAPVDKALLCQEAEHEFAGTPCGIMDQFISVFAQKDHLMLLDCREQTFEMIPCALKDVTVLVIDTQVKHDLADSQYAIRRQECENAARILGVASLREVPLDKLQSILELLDPTPARRVKHVVSEIERTIQFADAVKSMDWRLAGQLMNESHSSLREDYEVSCPELDLLCDFLSGSDSPPDVYGARMTGGGFGGCVVSLVENDSVSEAIEKASQHYHSGTGRELAAFSTKAANGAFCV